MAGLQREFCTKYLFWATNSLTKNAPKFAPKFLSLYFASQKIPQTSRRISRQLSLQIIVKSPTSFCRSAARTNPPALRHPKNLLRQKKVNNLAQRKTKGGGNSGEGKTYHKAPPQKRFWTPPLMIRFPPPPCSRPVIFLRGNGHRPDESHFLRPPKLVLEGALYGTFSPPKIAWYVLLPPLRIPNLQGRQGNLFCTSWNIKNCLARLFSEAISWGCFRRWKAPLGDF